MRFRQATSKHDETAKLLASAPVAARSFFPGIRALAIFFLLLGFASATENGGSVYPVGVDTVLPGMTPPPNGTMFYEFTTFYTASTFVNARGQSSVPGFKLDVLANAVKLVHNWNVHVLGGSLNSNLAVPVIYQRVTISGKALSKTGIGNITLGLAQIGYRYRDWYWSVEPDIFFPGISYTKSDPINIGQHNFAAGPGGALSYLPWRGKTEISSKMMYVINLTDRDTHYRSGNEFTNEYAVMQQVSKKVSVGVNGYLYQQTTDDLQDGVPVRNGFRGRDFTIGPEIRLKLGAQSGLVFKYQRDTLVKNRAAGGALWFQFCLPLPFGTSR